MLYAAQCAAQTEHNSRTRRQERERGTQACRTSRKTRSSAIGAPDMGIIYGIYGDMGLREHSSIDISTITIRLRATSEELLWSYTFLTMVDIAIGDLAEQKRPISRVRNGHILTDLLVNVFDNSLLSLLTRALAMDHKRRYNRLVSGPDYKVDASESPNSQRISRELLALQCMVDLDIEITGRLRVIGSYSCVFAFIEAKL